MSKKPVFYDPTLRRRKRVIFILFGILFGFFLFMGIMILSGIEDPILPLPTNFNIAVLKHRLHAIANTPTKECDQHRCVNSFSGDVIQKNIYSGSSNISAFFVEWDDPSTESLHRNLEKLSGIINEELTLTDTGIALIDPDRFSKTMDYIHAHGDNIPVIPLINNYDQNRNIWDGKRLAISLSDRAHREKLETSILDFIKLYHLSGINIDFEDLDTTTFPLYYDFLDEISTTLHGRNLILSVNVPFDNNNFDLSRIATSVDTIILMAYDQHWTGGAPGSISGIDWYENRLHAIVSTIPKEKIQIALGNYGYDWTQGGSGSTVTFQEAHTLAHDSEGDILFDQKTLSPHFDYLDESDHPHSVWYLDAVTAYNEMIIAQNIGINNFILWRLGSEDPSFWKLFEGKQFQAHKAPKELEVFGYGYGIDYAGSGELYRITREPNDGKRTLNFTGGLIRDEKITQFALPYEITEYGASDKKEINLTFDDGPDPKYTPQILDILKKANVPATFFVVGKQAEQYPYIIQRMYDEGHLIGNHSFTHPDISRVGDTRVHIELNLTERLIESITGHMSLIFRPPYGDDIEPEIPEQVHPLLLARELGYITVGMKIDPGDWQMPGVQAIVDRTLEQAESGKGNIVLLHDAGGNRDQTIMALPQIIATLRAHGFSLVSLDSLTQSKKDILMPIISGNEDLMKDGDSIIFTIFFTISWIIFIIFIGAMIIGFVRLGLVIILAIYQKIDSKNTGKKKKGSLPSVTVIVPAYNEGVIIQKTIESLIKSKNIIPEIIIIDDGSKDNTYAIAQEYANGTTIHAYTQENGGKGVAINNGITRSHGEIIVIIDADTIFDPYTLEHLLSHFHDQRIAAVSGNVKVGNRNNLITRLQAIEYITMQNLERRAYETINAINVVPGAVGAWRKSALVEVGGFSDSTLAEDSDMTFAILKKGYHIVHDHEAIAYTEAPEDWLSFMKQRFRWIFGILQVTYKHRGIVFDKNASIGLRFFIIPYLIFFQLFMPIIIPFVSISLIISLVFSIVDHMIYGSLEYLNIIDKLLGYFILFFIFDCLVGVLSFYLEKGEDKKLLLYLPLERLIFRYIFYWIILRALWSGITGRNASWNKIKRMNSV